MRVKNDSSKLPMPRSRSLGNSARVATCVALPLLVLAACGGNSASQVGGGAGFSSGATAGTADLIIPSGDGGGGNAVGSGGNGTPGPYMLPPDFTMAQMGGYKLGPAVIGAGGGASSAGGSTGSSCGTQILGVVRDFKGTNEPGGHPDFEHYKGDGASKGIVSATLGSDQRPVYTANGPFIDPANGQQTTSKADFDQWYRNTQDFNKPYLVYFYFQPNNNVLTFQSNAFFPIDGAGWGNTCTEAGATCNKQSHNFGFTTEVHTRFNYKGGETFAFTGDDDLWVFINHKLAIDLGGLHPKASSTVSLDAAAKSLGITVGSAYDLDLFHAERHTNQSNFRVDTNLEFTNCGTVIPDVPVK